MTRFVAGPDGSPMYPDRQPARAPVHSSITAALEAELVRAEQDGITLDQAPEIQGDGSALQGYLAGVRRALAIVRGEL